jgi:prepilin-type N-terminal cleavage/methylation domain-containing protein
MKMKKLKKGEKGFTLIELLIAIAITGLITGGITMTIFQVFNINTRTTNHMTAVRQVQNAGFWVSPDVQMAQSVNASGSSGLPLTLTWIAWGTNNTHEVIYTLEDMSGGLKKLQRSHSVNGGAPTVTPIAEYIDPDQTSCVWDGEWLTFNVTATVGGQSETRTYKAEPRPES